MLTKDLLKFRVRSERVSPVLIDPEEPSVVRYAKDIVSAFNGAAGRSMKELDEQLERAALTDHKLYAPFRKLLEDRCRFLDDDGVVRDARWDLLLRAKQLRLERRPPALEEFQRTLASSAGRAFDEIKDSLYADLPEFRRVAAFRPLGAEQLPHRYNCAQIQGLLLHANQVNVGIGKADVTAKRLFFRYLKFHRLMGDVVADEKKGSLNVTLSGPLAMFQNAQSYGMRLANFFPYLLHFKEWSLEAELKVKNKLATLKVNQKLGIMSHYQQKSAYLPEEFAIFVKAFNDLANGWTAEPGSDFVHIGRQSYCFPDITLRGPTGQTLHIELFHRWHRGQFFNRMKSLSLNPQSQLLVGVCRSLKSDVECNKLLENAGDSAIKVFWFNDFPTPRVVLTHLS